jgi:hypothetical protein
LGKVKLSFLLVQMRFVFHERTLLPNSAKLPLFSVPRSNNGILTSIDPQDNLLPTRAYKQAPIPNFLHDVSRQFFDQGFAKGFGKALPADFARLLSRGLHDIV